MHSGRFNKNTEVDYRLGEAKLVQAFGGFALGPLLIESAGVI